MKSRKTLKAVKFMNYILNVIEDVGAENIKSAIGDSTSNNRTLTVNQVLRFLKLSRTGTNRRRAASKLSSLRTRLSSSLRTNRRIIAGGNRRTDAYDISELLEVVVNNPQVAAASLR